MAIDGDDELIGRQVFKFFNSIFQKYDIWLMYSNFLVTPHNVAGFSRPYPDQIINVNKFRKTTFRISHLRTFYTKLFTLVEEKDLKDPKGEWFRASNDVAMYMPIM